MSKELLRILLNLNLSANQPLSYHIPAIDIVEQTLFLKYNLRTMI